MLGNSFCYTSIAVTDLNQATDFYQNKLGLKKLPTRMAGLALFEAGKGAQIFVYARDKAPKPDQTVLAFDVEDIETTIKELKKRGVEFKDYDTDQIKTVDSIATWGKEKAAWFSDPDGNIIALNQTV